MYAYTLDPGARGYQVFPKIWNVLKAQEQFDPKYSNAHY